MEQRYQQEAGDSPASVQPCAGESEAAGLDVEQVRRQFPVLSRRIYDDVPLVYLDSAATAQKPACVIESLAEHYRCHAANVHRGIHCLAEEATEAYEQARQKLARFIGARSPRQVVFTHGTTEGLNLVAWSWARTAVGPGDRLVVTRMEHHSNLVPWQQIARLTGAELQFAPLTDDGRLDLAGLERLLDGRTRLVALTGVSNVLGTINPVDRVVAAAHEVGAIVVVDGAQWVPHLPTDVVAWDCDFLAFSGHKMCGPEGVGVLYGKQELLESMPPLYTGGEMVRRVRWSGAEWNELPYKFEAGTPPIGPAIALGVAAEFLQQVGMESIAAHDAVLVEYCYRRLSQMRGVRVWGPEPPDRAAVVSFSVAGIHPHDLAQVLDRHGVAIRAGHHCAQPLHEELGLVASARASFYLYNTVEEVDRLAEGIKDAQRLFRC